MPKRTVPRRMGKPVHTIHEIVTVDSYRGMVRGDKVAVLGADGKKLSGRYEFDSYKVNVRTGRAWIEVNGGQGSKTVVWPYAISQVRKS